MKRTRKTWICSFIFIVSIILVVGCQKDDPPPSIEYGSLTDIDGNTYKTVKIGEQWWLAENLKTTRYNDGTEIPNITDNIQWSTLFTGAYAYYSNDAGNETHYGALYNWFAVQTEKLCPVGWQVPSDMQWEELIEYLGGIGVAGGKLKSGGTLEGQNGLWEAPNEGASNSSGFSAVPGGVRYAEGHLFDTMNQRGFYWTSTRNLETPYNVFTWIFYHHYGGVERSSYHNRSGFSVRCVK